MQKYPIYHNKKSHRAHREFLENALETNNTGDWVYST